jgi:hypothetical protein
VPKTFVSVEILEIRGGIVLLIPLFSSTGRHSNRLNELYLCNLTFVGLPGSIVRSVVISLCASSFSTF